MASFAWQSKTTKAYKACAVHTHWLLHSAMMLWRVDVGSADSIVQVRFVAVFVSVQQTRGISVI